MPKLVLTKKEKEELKKLQEEILEEAKGVVEDYTKNPSNLSGSLEVHIHESSPFLDESSLVEGKKWKHVLKTIDKPLDDKD